MTNDPSADARAWRDAILQRLTRSNDRPLKLRALARALDVSDQEYTTFRTFVRELLADGTLALGPGRTLRVPESTGRYVGVFRANRRGFGFVERPGFPDLYVAPDDTGGAFDGDTVRIRVLSPGRRGLGPRAAVVRILERATPNWVGVLERVGAVWEVRPQGRNPMPTVRVDNVAASGAADGDLVVVQPSDQTLRTPAVHGMITERLGSARDSRARLVGVIRRHGIPQAFKPEVLDDATAAAAAFDPENLDEREDLRGLLTVTIDPLDARDFDDAISIEPLDGGRARLGVHIADVAHFVTPGGPLDAEARRRGNSVYFPGVVVPMLPEALSNGVCSLQPAQPRYALSVFLTYDRAGTLLDAHFARAVIRSAARLTYEQVTALLAGREHDAAPEVLGLLRRADTLAKRIRQRRIRSGMIVLNVPEVAITLDARGQAVDSGLADNSFSHTIIEMFMVEANEAVARRVSAAGLVPLRRVHPEPEPTAAESLKPLGPILGRTPPRKLDRAAVRELLEAARGKPQEQTVHYFLLRAMSQAIYSPEHAGHFALASGDYCHFTSPIRRYADLTVHRQLVEVLSGGDARRPRDGDEEHDDALANLGRHLSTCERRALSAEREARALLLLQVMRRHVGEVLDGIVVGVISIGAFVRVQPYMAEGLVRIEDLARDEWVFDRDLCVLDGVRTARRVHVGLSVQVRVAAADEVREELVLVPAAPHEFGAKIGRARSKGEKHGRRTPRERKSPRSGGRRGRRR